MRPRAIREPRARLIGERFWERTGVLIENLSKAKEGGGDGGIRTLDTRYQVWLLSRELVSATHPRLRIRVLAARAAL